MTTKEKTTGKRNGRTGKPRSKQKTPETRRRSRASGSTLTKPLGLQGWQRLEAVLLAAVASETPLLLVGPHGSAKSFFLERLAKALGLEYRLYNASLINYDDLVGIPMPSEDRKRLEYISTPSSIWDAEVVFMDEINRTKPELQNKIFPIIHERRVQGVLLEKLRFRWAAMNPPMPESEDDDVGYLGAEPLDTALADRFGFIIQVPSWSDLSNKEQRAVLEDQFAGDHEFPVPVKDVLAQTRARLEELFQNPFRGIYEYLIQLSVELGKLGVTLSARRMTMLHANILAVHAATTVLSAPKGLGLSAWGDSAWTALQNSLPHLAEGCAPEAGSVRAAHLHAWKLALCSPDASDQVLLAISDPLERLTEALRRSKDLSPETLGAAVINCISETQDAVEQWPRVLALYLATHASICLPHTALAVMHPVVAATCNPGTVEIKLTNRHKEYLTNLAEQVEDEKTNLAAADHYALNMAVQMYEHTGRIRDCKRAIKRFHELHKQFNEAMTT